VVSRLYVSRAGRRMKKRKEMCCGCDLWGLFALLKERGRERKMGKG